MDKIIGMGNALVDVLATLNDDHLLERNGFAKRQHDTDRRE